MNIVNAVRPYAMAFPLALPVAVPNADIDWRFANLDRAFQSLDFFIQAITGGLGMFVALMNIFIHYFPYLVKWLPIITQTFILLFIFGLLKKIFFYIDQIYPITNSNVVQKPAKKI